MELVAEDLAVPTGGSAEEQLVAQQKMTNLLLNTIAVQVTPTATGALSFFGWSGASLPGAALLRCLPHAPRFPDGV